jgi:hypothetical protein
MRYELTRTYDGRCRFILDYTDEDLIQVALDPWDMALLRECEASGTIPDTLLALECLARRLEQQRRLL